MDPHKALFVGNSYTFCNKLPWIVSELASSSGSALEVDMVVKGGVDYEWHFNNQETLEAIRKSDWDFIVLQNRSLGPIEEKEKMLKYGTKLHREVQKTGAETVLYMTWARQHIPEMQKEITEAYISLAKEIGAKIAPVGLAWENALKADNKLLLHTEDKSHPNPKGSYLAACVFYSTFYDASPEGLTGEIVIDGENRIHLTDKEAGFFQSIAWKTVQNFEL
jgi:hypothetical protein